MRTTTIAALCVAVIGFAGTASAEPFVMYGANGGHNDGSSVNDGSVVVIDPITAAVSLIGRPDDVARLTGLAFDASGTLWATTLQPGFGTPPPPPATTSSLVRIDPGTGAQLSSVAITLAGLQLSVADLAVQPVTDTLFGVTGPNGPGPARLVTIDKTTGLATLVGPVGGAAFESFASIAFSPTGTLYASVAGFGNGPVNPLLATVNPSTGGLLTSVPTVDFFGALGIRPDGVIFGGTGDEAELFTISPLNGAQTLIGSTGRNYVGDFDFQRVPEPQTLMLFGTGLVVAAARRWGGRVRSSRRP